MLATVMAAETFTTAHIVVTAAITGALALAGAVLVTRRREALPESVLIGILAAVIVFLWRRSANMPQLNRDGLQGFSANDWLAPVAVWAALGVQKAFRRSGADRQLDQARALAVVVALVVNVVTI